MASTKRKQSETLKEKGNAAFKAGRYAEAVAHYSDAIAAAGAAEDTAALYSNRSFALLQLKDFRGAARDAYQCVRIDKQWPKGYYRLGLAMSGLRLYTKALEAFSVGLVAAPNSVELRAGFEKAQEAAAAQSLTTLTWHQHPVLASNAETPKQRCTHTLTPVGSRLVCFGGFGQGLYNDVSVISADTLTLLAQDAACTSPDAPCVRSSHSAVAHGDQVLVFGGYDGDKTWFDDTWALDVERGLWRQLVPRGGTAPPPARCSHGAVMNGREMVVFGGMGADSAHFNDVAVFDVRSQRWERPDVVGTAPAERNSHTFTPIAGGAKALCFGGCCGAERYFNDVHVLDLANFTWSQPAVAAAQDGVSTVPRPRMGHAAAAFGSRLYVFGGLVIEDKSYRAETFILDTERMLWVCPDLAGSSVPMPRIGHAMAAIRGGKLFSYGGDGGPSLGIMRDVWIADTDLEVAQLRSGLQEGELERVQLLESLQRAKATAAAAAAAAASSARP